MSGRGSKPLAHNENERRTPEVFGARGPTPDRSYLSSGAYLNAAMPGFSAVTRNGFEAFGSTEPTVASCVATVFPFVSRKSTLRVYVFAAAERFSMVPPSVAFAASRLNRLNVTLTVGSLNSLKYLRTESLSAFFAVGFFSVLTLSW